MKWDYLATIALGALYGIVMVGFNLDHSDVRNNVICAVGFLFWTLWGVFCWVMDSRREDKK